ncbi:hypothetical protein PSHT_09299 [Puccinia striiformis]|uniref:Uncharacterized protein n=1 Tax=Puccinia striiformis TaxID=27350 RepID=A0A2S4VHP8_9BASI|nr:hypothetical protein PSHT_09299 [Puccinia striiformis]
MDPHSAAAFYRMKLFLADLNHVLGAVIPLEDRPNFNHANFRNRSSDSRPTQRSRAWKRTRLPRLKTQIEGFQSQKAAKTCVVRLPSRSRPFEATYKEEQPEYNTQNVGRSESQFRQAPHCPHASEPKQQYLEAPHTDEPNQQYFEGPYANEPDQQYSERSYACEHDQQYFGREDYSEGLDDGSYIDGDSAVDEDVASDYHSDSSENRELPSDPVPEPLDTTLQEAAPEIVQPDQQEPEFDMDNYSATDVNRWARTLSAKQFVFLQLRGSAAQNESFRQYAISHIDRPTQSLTQDDCEHSHQRSERRSVTFNNQDEYINYEPDNTNHPDLHPFETGDEDQAPHHTSDSSFHNGSDDGDGLDHSHEVYLEDPKCNDVLDGDSNNFDGNGHNDDVYDDNGGGVYEKHDDSVRYNNCDDGGGYSDCEDGGAYSNGEDGDGYEHLDDGGGYEHFDDGGGSENFDDGDGFNDYDEGAGWDFVKFATSPSHDPSSMPPDVAQAFTRMSLFLEDVSLITGHLANCMMNIPPQAPGQENPSGECSSTKDPSSEVDGMSSGTSQSIASASTPQQPTTIRIEPLHTAPRPSAPPSKEVISPGSLTATPIEPTASTTSVGQPLATDLGPPEWTTYEDAVYKILEMKEDLVRVYHLESALISGLEVLRNGKRILPKSKRDGQPHIYFSSSLVGQHKAAIYSKEMVWIVTRASVEKALEAALEIKARIEALDSDDD